MTVKQSSKPRLLAAAAGVIVLTIAGVVAVGMLSGREEPQIATDNDPVASARQNGKPTVVEFGSNGCVSCREMKPILQALARDYGDRLNVVDVDLFSISGRRFISKYRIQMMPTQVFYDAGGVERSRNLGPISAEQILQRLGVASSGTGSDRQ
ncbi:TlpA family protein disulfide reductase [Blastochloris tepida]|uniref:Thioredoxin domain-containing protein n=1 Tax=Blastochloris tepida TaxID=2233851 RepID=A0A348FYE9_9HYPH|nr:thioredoxin family protein [Blastochloris tepida]BBF92332.1 hypothetical protein BLTE_10170 [Blastochloris tepida]